jgi:hypothetical protein
MLNDFHGRYTKQSLGNLGNVWGRGGEEYLRILKPRWKNL